MYRRSIKRRNTISQGKETKSSSFDGKAEPSGPLHTEAICRVPHYQFSNLVGVIAKAETLSAASDTGVCADELLLLLLLVEGETGDSIERAVEAVAANRTYLQIGGLVG